MGNVKTTSTLKLPWIQNWLFVTERLIEYVCVLPTSHMALNLNLDLFFIVVLHVDGGMFLCW